MRIVLFLLVFFALFAPMPGQAQGGLIPCGMNADDPDTSWNETDPCQLCHLLVLADNIIDAALTVYVPIIAVLLIAWGGFVFLTSAGNPERQATGKRILFAVLIGFLIIYGSWVFLNFLFTFFGITSWGGLGEWWTIDCSP